jgi:hypothetical protein
MKRSGRRGSVDLPGSLPCGWPVTACLTNAHDYQPERQASGQTPGAYGSGTIDLFHTVYPNDYCWILKLSALPAESLDSKSQTRVASWNPYK